MAKEVRVPVRDVLKFVQETAWTPPGFDAPATVEDLRDAEILRLAREAYQAKGAKGAEKKGERSYTHALVFASERGPVFRCRNSALNRENARGLCDDSLALEESAGEIVVCREVAGGVLVAASPEFLLTLLTVEGACVLLPGEMTVPSGRTLVEVEPIKSNASDGE